MSIMVYTFSQRDNAAHVKAKFIIEAANHPTDPEADEVNILTMVLSTWSGAQFSELTNLQLILAVDLVQERSYYTP